MLKEYVGPPPLRSGGLLLPPGPPLPRGTWFVLLRGHLTVVAPLRLAARVEGHMDHVAVRAGSVPVPLARRGVDDVAGARLHRRLALGPRASGAGEDRERLAAGVRVPVGPGAGFEEDPVHTEGVGSAARQQDVQPDPAGE